MVDRKIVSGEEWQAARIAFLDEEKAFTRARDRLSAARRALPWVKVDKDYVFDGPDGQETLTDLFDGSSQLIVQHFMYGPDWEEECASCSFWTDNFNGITVHLNHRDISFVLISNAPLDKLESYRRRMGWDVKWLSSLNGDFNRDYHVSFSEAEQAAGEVYYNYGLRQFPATEAPGLSVFHKDEDGQIFHTYSTYARGLDMLNGAYHLMDLVPNGRDEQGLDFSMGWLRRHDSYEE